MFSVSSVVSSLQPDSGFFSEDNSSDDDAIVKEQFRGIIVKQGCLLKQVSMCLIVHKRIILGI